MTFEVTKEEQDRVESNRFLFKYYREVESKNGETVEVVDREEWKTIEDLNQQKKRLDIKIIEIQTEIDAINNLK